MHILKTPHHARLARDWRIPMVDVAMATSAAPLYFPAARVDGHRLIDGGVRANNPSVVAVAEAVSMFADLVAEHGYAELRGVPGDQQTELRRQIRSLVRKGTGHTCRTFVHGNMVVVVCEPIAKLHHEEQLADAAKAIDAYLRGEPRTSRPDPEWRLRWSAWATD